QCNKVIQYMKDFGLGLARRTGSPAISTSACKIAVPRETPSDERGRVWRLPLTRSEMLRLPDVHARIVDKISRAGNMPGAPPPLQALRLLTGRTGFPTRKKTVLIDTLVANMPKRTKKLLVYLDQNFISEMAKAEVNVKVKQEWKDLFSLLKEGFLGEKLVVPRSWFHDVETSFAPILKKRIVTYQNYLGQVDLHRAPNVRINQTARFLERFLCKGDQDPLGTEIAFRD